MTDVREQFLAAALWHGDLERAEAILATHRDLRNGDIHVSAVLGDAAGVHRLLSRDATLVHAKAPPYGGDPLNYLCLSRYLRLDHARSDGFLEAARALLDAGADPNTGFWTTGQYPERETALYGAAGVAHHAGLTRLLVERGADPNDVEVTYHGPEGWDNAALKVLVERGRLTADSLATMLIRKADWHDLEGIRYLLAQGADPNRTSHWQFSALLHAIRRDNDAPNIKAMLDHGGDPTVPAPDGRSSASLAARRGRADLLQLFERRGFPLRFEGVERLIAACARMDEAAVRSLAEAEPDLVRQLLEEGGTLLTEFAGTWNAEGVRLLLDLGVPVDAQYGGDGYFGIAPDSTALHVAAWKADTRTVKVLIARGASIDARDRKGRTPLALAVKACVDSYWMERRSPDSTKALLQAGASAEGVGYPCGYEEVDRLLAAHR